MNDIEFPYPGLRPFREHEIDIFFGRDKQIIEIAEKLTLSEDDKFIAVVGASGIGKSSFVLTGLFNYLKIYSEAKWELIRLSPSNTPIQNLSAALIANNAFNQLVEDIERYKTADNDEEKQRLLYSDIFNGNANLKNIMQSDIKNKQHFLIVVDQFEELFREAKENKPVELKAFIQFILGIANEPNIYIVITMRADFIDNCLEFHGLPEAINKGLFILPRLTTAQLRQCIEAPVKLKKFDYKVDHELTEYLINQIDSKVYDQLPLMQHALRAIWFYARNHESDTHLTLEHYDSVGKKSLSKTLSNEVNLVIENIINDNYLKFLGREKIEQAIEIIFRSLVDVSIDKLDIRRSIKLSKLVALTGINIDLLNRILCYFRANYIDPITYETELDTKNYLEEDKPIFIIHESFIRNWDKLQVWCKQEKDLLDKYETLKKAAKKWEEEEDEKEKCLWSSSHNELNEVQKWYESPQNTQTWASLYDGDEAGCYKKSMEFYLASVAKKENEERKRNEEELEKQKMQEKTINLQKKFLIVSIFALVSVILAFIYVLHVQNEFKIQRDLRIIDLFNSQIKDASVFVQQQEYDKSQQQIAKTYLYDKDVPINQQSKRNFLANFNSLKLNNKPLEPSQKLAYELFSASLNNNQELLAVIGFSNQLYVFNTHDLTVFASTNTSLSASPEFAFVKFLPNQNWLVVAGDSPNIEIFELTADKQIKQKQIIPIKGYVSAVAISPDGQHLITGDGDGKLSIFEYQQNNQFILLTTASLHQAQVDAIAFKDNQTIASAAKKQILLSNITNFNENIALHSESDVYALAFHPNKQQLVTAGNSSEIWTWDIGSPASKPSTLDGHQNDIYALEFLNDEQLVSASKDKTIRIWELANETLLKMFTGHAAQVTSLALKQQHLFSVSTDGQLLKWDIDLSNPQVTDTPKKAVSVAIAPNFEQLIVGFSDGRLAWYDVKTQQFEYFTTGHNDEITRLAISPNNQWLASSSLDNTVKIWAIKDSTQEPLETLKHQGVVSAVAFSPDSQLLASVSYDGSIYLKAINTQQPVFIETNAHGEGSEINSVEFSQDGQLLISAADNSVKLWQVVDNKIMQSEDIEFDENMLVLWAALSPDKQRVAVVGKNPHLVLVKDLQTEELIQFSSHDSAIQKAIFSPDSQQLLTASSDATVRVWNLADNLINSHELFPIFLPIKSDEPLWDFDFRCAEQGKGQCWLAVPLTNNRLALYDFGKIYQ